MLMFMTAKKISPLSILGVLVVLSGCSALPSSQQTDSASVLNGEGRYKQVEKTGELTPEEQHALAVAQVDPKRVNKKNAYVKTAEQSMADQEKHSRVVALERDIGVVKNEFKGLRDTVSRADIAPASGTPGVSVKGLRTGVYPDKTRLVLDMDGPSEFAYEIDTAQNLLVIRLSAQNWDAPQERVLNNNLIKAYAAKRGNNGGTVVALKLQKPARVITGQKLGKNAAGNHRIYFDVAPL